MHKKLLVGFVILIALVIFLGAVVVPKLLDPNRYKPEILAAVKSSTGRDLQIKGELSVSIFPLRIRLPEMELANDPDFGSEPFAKIQSAALDAQLKPLLQGNLIVDSVSLKGVKLNLARDKSGRNNWGSMVAGDSGGAPAEGEQSPGGGPIKSVEIGKLEMRDAELTMKDAVSGKTYALRNVNLETGRIKTGQPLEFTLGADVEYDSSKSRIDAKSQLLISEDHFQLNELDLKLDDSRLTGSAEAQNPSQPVWNFDFVLDQFDLDRYMTASTQSSSSGSPAEQGQETGAGMNGNGKVRIGNFKAFGLQLSDIQLEVHAVAGEIRIGPSTARLYGGTYAGNSRVGPPAKARKIFLDEKLSGIQIASFLRDAAGITRYSGSGSVHLKMETHSGGDLVKGLKGSMDLNLLNGKIAGFDLLKIVNEASALASAIADKEKRNEKLMAVPSQPGDETLFSSMAATMKFANGIARTDNIRLKGSAMDATGAGMADLNRQVVDYKLQVTLKDSQGKNISVPVYVSGSFSNPKFGVDTGTLIKQTATKAVKKEVEKGLQKLFKKKPPK